jgi:serine phosphatase RsbU (regulator of sigma subunit)
MILFRQKEKLEMSILIVDDNPTNLLIIVKILENAGYSDLVTASSAKEMFRKLKMDAASATTEIPIDLILLDMMMPEIDGIEACKRIQQVERLKDIPIVFVTAMGDSIKLAEALDAGAIDYVIKPINKVELLARIRSALRLKFEKDWHKERDMRINYELELAKQVQASVLSQPIDDENIIISSVYQPSFELAGDFYAWYRINNNQYGIILLDMMGHGISSSLVCMFISSVLQDTIKRISDPEQVICELNRYMNQLYMIDKLVNYYFTAIYLVLDTEQKTIEYVNAGHPPGLVYLDNKMALLEQSCCAIGFFENIKINKGKLQYQDTVKIVLFTDGLIETIEEGRDNGIDKLIEKMQKYKDLDLPGLMEKFIPEGNNDNQEDDVCLVMITTK